MGIGCKLEFEIKLTYNFILIRNFIFHLFCSATIENGALMHPDIHNALVAIKDTSIGQQNGTAPSHSGSSGRSTPNNADSAPGKLFVGGLSWQTSADKLKEYFGMFGNVTDVLIMKDPVTQV